jgi:hypothetical protein
MRRELQPGILVRYDETTSRWFVAVVRRVSGDQVELEYLNGYREAVPADKLTPFLPHLRSRDRVLSLKRDDLCYVLYGRVLSRLRQDRVEEMQKFLRSHGLRFRPVEWSSGSRVQIRPDNSFIEARISDTDREYEALLPSWLEPHRLPPGSRDPLGFQTYAEKIADEFLPGLTVFTTRIGYYGFIAWAVRELNKAQFSRGVVRRELFHRLERALALCEFVNHGKEEKDCRLLGQRSKSEVLQSAENNRFRVPKRILKNQESAGALRLYSTSIEKNSFAKSVPEQAVDNLLPFTLTDLGARLARGFERRVPNGFWEFAFGEKGKDRDAIREWGKSLCFSKLGKLKYYRDPFLEGFLLGGGPEAEARYRTVKLLFSRKLLRDDYPIRRAREKPRNEALSEEEAATLEEPLENEGLGNGEVLLRFYEERTSPEVAKLQKAAVFELLSLAHTAIFAHVIASLENTGKVLVKDLLNAIVRNKPSGRLWQIPMDAAGRKADTARVLVEKLFVEESPAVRAAIGGALLARVRADACLGTVAVELAGTPVVMLLEALSPDKTMAESYEGLLQAMVARHEQVSLGKNRQRWCYLDSGAVAKDELRPLGVGWHAMRFPQLHSLCWDLRLGKEDLVRGD